MISVRHLCAIFVITLAIGTPAQNSTPAPTTPATVAPKSPPVKTATVNPDGSITFRYSAPSATTVLVNGDFYPHPTPLTRDDAGLWTLTTPPLPPESYGYNFIVDGVNKLDPTNPDTRPNFISSTNNILVPGQPPMPWELTNIPHGDVIRRIFTTHIVKHLPQDQNNYVVYTPPNYDAHRKGGYPVLYLFHGYSDNALAWTEVGHANLILDSLIDSGKAVPMIVVMPLGYGDLDNVTSGHWGNQAAIGGNTEVFSQELLTAIMPAVEHDYNVAKGRQNRAITGLSMGGLESLSIGLNHPGLFAYVGGFSSGGYLSNNFDATFPHLDARTANLKLLWIACGSSDRLLKTNTDLIAYLTAKNFAVTPIQTPGAHSWLVWRDNLIHFAPLLFK